MSKCTPWTAGAKSSEMNLQERLGMKTWRVQKKVGGHGRRLEVDIGQLSPDTIIGKMI
ncbi:hypothetical protein J6590_012596 [Homalodisca vitripennis]|nr:hypothetical protein J6590_012596 [Homalodisca vitripennis]